MPTHHFFPHKDLPSPEIKRVDSMIKILGLNHGSIVSHRKTAITQQLRLESYEDCEPINQFPTAYLMASDLIEDNLQDSILNDFI